MTVNQITKEAVDDYSMISTLGLHLYILPDGRVFDIEGGPSPSEITQENLADVLQNVQDWLDDGYGVVLNSDQVADIQILNGIVHDQEDHTP